MKAPCFCDGVKGWYVGYRGETITCQCGCAAAVAGRRADAGWAKVTAALGLQPQGQSIVEPRQVAGRTVLTGGGQ